MLLAQESSLEKSRKKNLGTVNMAKGTSSISETQDSEAHVHLTQASSGSGYDSGYNSNQGRGGGRNFSLGGMTMAALLMFSA